VRLYQVTVAYDRARIEGLTPEDLVDAISASYGRALLQPAQIGSARLPAAVDLSLGMDRTVTAEWASTEYSVTLVHTNYPSEFSLVLKATEPERLARVAAVESERLDAQEAPQREVARQQKEADENQVKAEKARKLNKPLFRF
jgi:hypothetical protein